MLQRAANKRAKPQPAGESAKRQKSKPHENRIKKTLGDERSKDEVGTLLEDVVLGGPDLLEKLGHVEHSDSKNKRPQKNTAAWVDPEDCQESTLKAVHRGSRPAQIKDEAPTEITTQAYCSKLKHQLDKVVGTPSWARLKKDRPVRDEDDEDPDVDELLKTTGDYLSKSDSLPKGIIQMERCRDLNYQHHAKGKITALEFHPTAQVAMTAGLDHSLCLFQVDGRQNPLIQSVFFPFPVTAAHFSRDGTQVVTGSKRRDFSYFDMMAGKIVLVPRIKGLEGDGMSRFHLSPDGEIIAFMGSYGRIHLVSAKSKEWITTLMMNGSVESLAFTPDGTSMLSHGDGGEVYVWDLQARSCVHRFHDDGCIKGMSLAVSHNGRMVATGCDSGVVNLYDATCLTSRSPTPLKSIMNLTSPCTHLAFNATSEILALASRTTENALKLVHVPSRTVFSNFPTSRQPLGMPCAMDFSLNSGYFSLASHKGHALLYRVKHYGDY